LLNTSFGFVKMILQGVSWAPRKNTFWQGLLHPQCGLWCQGCV
jgi:hypothetical protein